MKPGKSRLIVLPRGDPQLNPDSVCSAHDLFRGESRDRHCQIKSALRPARDPEGGNAHSSRSCKTAVLVGGSEGVTDMDVSNASTFPARPVRLSHFTGIA